jgi:hypothetical protein
MNSSLFTCGRSTHLKIVVVALVAAVVVVVAGLNSRIGDTGSLTAGAKTNGMVVKASKLSIYAVEKDTPIR